MEILNSPLQELRELAQHKKIQMNLNGFHQIDLALVLIYLGACLILGLKRLGMVKTIKEYALGHKPFSTPVMIATTFATAISAHKTIGNVGKSYSFGLIFILTMFLIPLGWFVMARLLSKHLELFRKKKFMSLGDIMEHWYGKLGRNLTTIGAIFFTLGITAAGSMATGKLMHYFFGINELLGMIVALTVVTAYSTFGGIYAVAVTDVFQFLIFFIAIPLACAIGYNDMGGYKNIFSALPKTHLSIDVKQLGLFVGMAVFASMPNADVPFIHRALLCKSKSQLVKIFSATGILMIPFFVVIALIGLMMHVQDPSLHNDTVLFHFVRHYLPVGVIGLMISGMLAIIMSTQDSFLNTTSILIARDICKQIWPSLDGKKELQIARLSCVLIALLSLTLVFVKDNILDLIWFVTNFWDPLVVVPLIMAMLGIRINKRAFFIVPLTTLTAQTITRFMVGSFDTRSFSVGVLTSVITLYALSKYGRKV